MSRTLFLMSVVVALFTCFLGGIIYAQQKAQKLRGIEPYTPTKLEWLALELNAEGREELTADGRFSLAYAPIEKAHAILIYVRHMPDARQEVIRIATDGARRLIEDKAKNRGWDWVTIKQEVEQIDPRKTGLKRQGPSSREPGL